MEDVAFEKFLVGDNLESKRQGGQYSTQKGCAWDKNDMGLKTGQGGAYNMMFFWDGVTWMMKMNNVFEGVAKHKIGLTEVCERERD